MFRNFADNASHEELREWAINKMCPPRWRYWLNSFLILFLFFVVGGLFFTLAFSMGVQMEDYREDIRDFGRFVCDDFGGYVEVQGVGGNERGPFVVCAQRAWYINDMQKA